MFVMLTKFGQLCGSAQYSLFGFYAKKSDTVTIKFYKALL